MSELLEAALKYARWGWPVFPVMARGKKPLTFRGFKDASTDEHQIREWWAKWPEANIGLPTGATSKTAVVDIDLDKGGEEALAGLVAKNGDYGDPMISKTGGGGRHLIFAFPDSGFPSSAGKIANGIDTRGTGGYIVLPPSVHSSGGKYAWENSPETAPAPPPDWLIPGNIPDLSDIPHHTGPSPESRCRAYLDKCPPAISGEGGHDKTFRAACEAFRFGLTESQAWDLLNHFNGSKCSPPWTEKELRHKIKSARAKVDETGEFGKWLNNGDAPDLPEPEPLVLEFPTPLPTPVFPPELLSPPGMVGKICQWVNNTSFKPQPILTLANVLAFYGAVVGRKVQTPSRARTNLYCLGIGASGCGKDHSRKAIKELADAAGLTAEIFGGEEVSSDAAIYNSLAIRPSLLFQFDEIGHMLSQTNSKYAQAHQRAIAPTFTKLFSSASTILLGKEYAGEHKRRDIDQPNACLYGTTVPERLYDGLVADDINDGFMGRILVFQSDNPRPAKREVFFHPPSQDLTDNVLSWFRRDVSDPKAGNLRHAARHAPMTIPIESDAAGVFRAFDAHCDQQAIAADAPFDVIWSRAHEHALKVALILACGNSFDATTIDATTAAWSVALIGHVVPALIETLKDSVASTPFEANVLYVKRNIRNHPSCTATTLFKATRKLSGRERLDAITHLIAEGSVVKTTKKSPNSREITTYAIK